MSDLEMKLKVIKDYEEGKSIMVTAHPSCMSHSTIAIMLKNKNEMRQNDKVSASLKALRISKIQDGHISYMEKLLLTGLKASSRIVCLYIKSSTVKVKSLFCL